MAMMCLLNALRSSARASARARATRRVRGGGPLDSIVERGAFIAEDRLAVKDYHPEDRIERGAPKNERTIACFRFPRERSGPAKRPPVSPAAFLVRAAQARFKRAGCGRARGRRAARL